jgi:hypothetical protein
MKQVMGINQYKIEYIFLNSISLLSSNKEIKETIDIRVIKKNSCLEKKAKEKKPKRTKDEKNLKRKVLI